MKSTRGQNKPSLEHVQEVSQLGETAEGRRSVLR